MQGGGKRGKTQLLDQVTRGKGEMDGGRGGDSETP